MKGALNPELQIFHPALEVVQTSKSSHSQTSVYDPHGLYAGHLGTANERLIIPILLHLLLLLPLLFHLPVRSALHVTSARKMDIT